MASKYMSFDVHSVFSVESLMVSNSSSLELMIIIMRVWNDWASGGE